MSRDTYRKIGLATLIMMGSIFLSRLMGLFREMTIAAVGGADAAVDAYRVAFVVPEILNHILASGFLSVTFIPIFTRYLTEDEEAGGWRVFSNILTVFGTLLCVLVLVAMVLAPRLVAVLAPGRDDPAFFSLAVRMTRIVLPAQFFFFTGGMFMAVQFAKERFTIPAMAPLLYNTGIILGGLILGPRIGMEGFAWGVLAGAFAGNFLIQLLGTRRAGMVFRFRFEPLHPDLIRYLTLTLPLMLGLTMTFSTELFSKFFGSFLPEGAIAWIDYGLRIMLLVVAFFGQAVGVASYPYLARLAAAAQWKELNRLLNNTLRYLALVIPVSALVMVLRSEIVRLLFERGQFTPHDTRMTARALSGLLIGAVAFAAQTVVNRGFYAKQNTITPALFGSIAVVLSLPLYWLGLTMFGVAGVGAAVSLSALIQVGVLYAVWNRRSGNIESREVYRFYLKMTAAALVLGGLLEVAHELMVRWINTATIWGSLLTAGGVTLLFGILAAAGSRLFHIPEAERLWRRLTIRFRKESPTHPS